MGFVGHYLACKLSEVERQKIIARYCKAQLQFGEKGPIPPSAWGWLGPGKQNLDRLSVFEMGFVLLDNFALVNVVCTKSPIGNPGS